MSKLMEQEYLNKIGEGGRLHVMNKPFSDPYCGLNLSSFGVIMDLLPNPPARILDMGCGGGWTSVFLAKAGYEVVGQDISQDMIDLAREYQAQQNVGENLSFRRGDFEDSSDCGQFDMVIFFDCLHHAENESAAIASAFCALRPGGILVTHEPGEGHATALHSLEAVKLYGVTEKDMPPRVIIENGLRAGFSTYRVYPMQHELTELFYRQPVPPLFSKAAWLRAKRALKAAFRPSHSAGAIVVMTK